jgi:hypothetical protein
VDAPLSPSRRLLVLAIALIALFMLPAAASAAPVQARSAASFVDSIGVNTHTYYSDTVYASEFGTITQRLRELGIHHIRENLVPNRPDQYQHLNDLAAAGIKSTLILGAPEDGSAGLAKLTSILGSSLRGSVDAVEGPNEYDLHGGSDWMSKLAPYQSELYTAIKSNPATSALPVVGPSLGNTNSDGSDVSGSLDYGNIHSYPNGEAPEDNVPRMLSMAGEMSGSKPVMATETGYHTAVNWSGDHKPVSEAAEATYMPRLFLDYFNRGVARTFSYELVDEFPNAGNDEPESNFGLLRNDLSPKPAFTALRNLTTILADPSSAFAPGALDYSVTGNTDGLQQLLLQKSDGSFYLALWRDESVWDNQSLTPETAASGSVQLNIAETLASAEEFQPNSSGQPLRALATGGPIIVKVGPQVTILRLSSTGTPAVGGIKVWVSKRSVESGGRVAVKGKLTGPVSGEPTPVTIQRWSKGTWQTVAKGHTSGSGHFQKLVRMVGKPQAGPSRIRVIAQRAKPSNQVKVRILARGGGSAGPAVAVAAGTEVPTASPQS